MNLVMRRNPTTFDLGHVTLRDIMLTIDRVVFVSIDSIYGVSNI